jgi:hypothetical protein
MIITLIARRHLRNRAITAELKNKEKCLTKGIYGLLRDIFCQKLSRVKIRKKEHLHVLYAEDKEDACSMVSLLLEIAILKLPPQKQLRKPEG